MDDKSDSQIIDENKDFLDDRIVEPKESKGKETAPSIAKRVDHLRLSELPEELLRKMLEDIEMEQKRLSKQASEVEKSLHKELLRGNASILDEKKKDIRLIEREFEGFDDDRQNIYDALQNKVVIEGMVKVLGGKKRLYASEWTAESYMDEAISDARSLYNEYQQTGKLDLGYVACIRILARLAQGIGNWGGPPRTRPGGPHLKAAYSFLNDVAFADGDLDYEESEALQFADSEWSSAPGYAQYNPYQ